MTSKKKTKLPATSDAATAYAREVVDGDRIAGPHVRAQCARHLKDIKDGSKRGLVWNLGASNRAQEFFPDVLKLNGGQYEGKPFTLLPWQQFVIGSLFGWHGADGFRRFRSAYIETSKGPLALDTPVATPVGWTTMGEIQPGDFVFDDQGRPTKVMEVSPVFHDRDCYKLTFSDGVEIVADAEHRWNTAALRSGRRPGPHHGVAAKGCYGKRTTAEIADTLCMPVSASVHPQAKWNHRIEVAPSLSIDPIELPVQPYTLGAWLGDGDSDAARMTGVDHEIFDCIEADGYRLGGKCSKQGTAAVRLTIGSISEVVCRRGHDKATHASGQHCLACERELDRARRRGEQPSAWTEHSLQEKFLALGVLNNKHIPSQYLRAGTDQRLALLQGLMDTDGTIAHGGKCEIDLCHERLSRDTLALIRTLGFKAQMRESDAKLNGRVVGRRWRIGFQAYKSMPPFRLQRKRDRLGDEPATRALSRGRMIVGCEPVDSVPVRCITVEADSHMFLAGVGLVPTCNSGKSPIAAAIGMYGLVSDNEPRAEIYSAATKRDQAMILFRDAVAMRDQSPELSKRLTKSGTGERCWNLAYMAQGAFFRPISSDDGQSGPRPHIGLIDELHEHKTNAVVEMMRAGTKSRRQAMIFMITNAGHNRMGPCWGYHEYGAKVASGSVIDDAFFAYICGLDDGDDPFANEDCWLKANPSLQDADLPGMKYIREQVVEAKGMPSKEAIVRRLNFCQWTDAESPWISGEVWKGAYQDFDWRDLRGRRAVVGLDLSSTTDLTGMVFLVEPIEDGEPWKLVPFAWLPDVELQRKADSDRVPYIQWRAEGYLDTTPGRAISKRVILQKLSAMCDFFEIIQCGYDRWRIEDLLSMAADDGISLPDMKPVGQGYKDFSPAIETFERMLLNGEIVHAGHKVLDWCMSNAVIEQDGAENRKLSKEKATGRIDLAVAAVMAAGLVNSTAVEAKSFWEAEQ